MMTEHEYKALIDILNRAPVSQSEALWLTTLLARLAAEIKAAQPAAKIKTPEGGA